METYRDYLTAANQRAWAELESYVADQVSVNGNPTERSTYVQNLQALACDHPDHQWQLTDFLVDGDRIAVRLTTSRSGHAGFELAHYIWTDGRIVEVWTIGT